MIEYEQLPGEGLRDVKLTTDDAQAEMVNLQEAFEPDATEMQTYSNIVASQRQDDGNFRIDIPGDEVAEVSEIIWDVDSGALENAMDKWNQESLDAIDE